MNILDINLEKRTLDYASKLIIRPLVSNNNLNTSTFCKKKLALIIKNDLEKGYSIQNLASSLGHYSKNWNIDWHWIAHHIFWDYYNTKQAQTLLKMYGPNQQVFKSIDKTYSPECLALYLTDSTNRKSEPKLFTLSELISNGSNLGKENKDWKSVIGVTDFGFYKNLDEIEHYYDNTIISTKSDWEIWDYDKGCYKTEAKPLTERQKKIRKLIKVTVTDDCNVISSSINRAEHKSVSKQRKQLKWWQKILK